MMRFVLFMVWMAAAVAINRPVYKVTLTQRGFTQFLQYDLETPPLIEFTFCTWVRLYNLSSEQTFFSYIVNSNKNMVRLWVDPGGRNVQLAINGWLATTSPIEMMKDVWKHVCVSYQSDYGAWALYVDSRLVTCGASQALLGFVLPPGGSVSVGYGTSDDGMPSGVEGEIFGANMILLSTIERNYTMKQNPRYKQRRFRQNRIKKNRAESNEYIIFDKLKENTIQNSFEITPFPSISNFTTSPTVTFRTSESSNERDMLDFSITDRTKVTTLEPTPVQFWHLVNNNLKHNGAEKKGEPFNAETRDLPSVSEFETPPPPNQDSINAFKQKHEEKLSVSSKGQSPTDATKYSQKEFELSEVEVPPPPQTDDKVYGQWVSSKFVGSVLNHLRNMRYNKRDKPIPDTIPLHKISDAFPYASEFKLTKLKPPAKFERRNLGVKPSYSDIFGKRRPQYSVQILEDDIREKIQRSHSKLKAKNVNVVNKGEPKLGPKNYENHDRFNREAKYSSSESEESIETPTPRPFTESSDKKNIIREIYEGLNNKNNLKNLLTVLPYIKALEDLIVDSTKNEEFTNSFKSDVYTRSLSNGNGNKWHNIKSYSNDYTPRQVDLHSAKPTDIHTNLVNDNNKHPAVRLNYKGPIKQGQNLAKTVSSQADVSLKQTQNPDSISIQHFVYDPSSNKHKKGKSEKTVRSNNFNKHVKIGNALNEVNVIGKDALQKKNSFEGGDVRVPDINRYRSDIDELQDNVPPSLSPKICKNVELYDRVLYIQPDESVDLSFFLSPVKLKNHAIEFIQQNYKMCSYHGSLFEKDPLLYINWSKTPVRLFGGAYLQTTTDLCGFFKR